MAFIPLSLFIISSTLQYATSNFTFPSKSSSNGSESFQGTIKLGESDGPDVQGRNLFNFQQGTSPDGGDGQREGKNLLNWIDDFVAVERDPYIKKINDGCLEGNLYECFKYKALSNLDLFFNYDQYGLNENTKVIKIFRETPVNPENSEFARSIPQTQEPEFDSFLQFIGRKIESFVKSRAIEVSLPEEITDYGRYEPRAIFDDISSEVDILEDKKDNLINRRKLKKLIIPLLIVLKLFKLKLLLFLPLILGLAGFKKVLGLLAIAIPGLIGYFKFCKPQQNTYGSFGHSNYYSPPHSPPFVKESLHQWSSTYGNEYSNQGSSIGGGGISFKQDIDSIRDNAQNIAYQSYGNKK